MRLLKWFKEEILSILPAVIYFFIAFTIFYLTFGWMQDQELRHLTTFPRVIIGAIIVGKVMLVADTMPLMTIFRDRPMIFGIIWKTAVYYTFALCFQLCEQIIPLIVRAGNILAGWHQWVVAVWWARFVTIQVWLVVLFLTFEFFRALVRLIGPDKFRRSLFG